jgi:hypothetical protein
MYGLGPLYTTCDDCGAAYPTALAPAHECRPERWADHQLFRLRDEVDRFEWEWRVYLASPQGRFEVWYAARTRP